MTRQNSHAAGPTRDTAGARLPESLTMLLELQRTAFVHEGIPTAELRKDRLRRLSALLGEHARDLIDAMTQDFGSRPASLSLLGDIVPVRSEIGDLVRHLSSWMKPTNPSKALVPLGIRRLVRHDPLGVVGVMAPWNFPVQLSLMPAAAAMAAGNRVMVRPSSETAHTTELLDRLAARYFSEDEFAVVTQAQGSGSQFARLPFDALCFTGSPEVGRSVAAEAGRNLVPVTLELGGKNPAIVDTDANLAEAARRVAQARITNSGQVCLSPEFAFVPAERVEEFVEGVLATWRQAFPAIRVNPDYTSVISDGAYERILGLIENAVALGATVRSVVPDGESLPDRETRKIPPTVLTGVQRGMRIEEEEVFGPVLTVYPYGELDEVISYLNERDHPLTLYWFGPRNRRFAEVVERTRSGSVQGNDFLINMSPRLPFGGVGKSGMGAYHGEYGFRTFTQPRAVAHSEFPLTLAGLAAPPYGFFRRRLDELAIRIAAHGSRS